MRISLVFMMMALFSTPAYSQDIERGEALFKRKCKGCHRLSDGVKVGPGMAGVTNRRSDEWLDKWLQDPHEMIENGDPVAVKLKKKYKKTMRKLKSMQDETNRKDIIAFLKENDKEQD